ncbi:hypothetical protein EJ02DRAFT_514195 [Clathrospora elynae]|uniref:Uncharacterized protein n=1 Tax=Clathrospora elynae TaxID=706981 RepID=A0A6A5SH74_9PLEO|nr:hypothetical protein EJ02DRAFT_514195 [Clathrospora elynae]
MRYSSIILGLAATASALDVRLHYKDNCSGASFECLVLPPDVSAFPSHIISPYSPQALVLSLTYVTRTAVTQYKGSSPLLASTASRLTGTSTSGATDEGTTRVQSSSNKKRGTEVCDADAEAPEVKCTASQKVDVLVLEDGQKYYIADMEGSVLDDLVALAVNGTAAADVPRTFKQFKLST